MADDRKIVIDIEAKDYASSVFRSVSSGVSTFAINANNGIIRANNALRSYNSTMRGFNSIVQRAMVDAGRAIYNFTTDAIKQFAELEQQHARTMGAMASDYDFNYNGNNTMTQQVNMAKFYSDSDKLKQQAIRLGTYGPDGNGSLYDPTEISSAQTALIKAGIDPTSILNTDALTNILKFAGGNQLSLDTATEFAVQLGTQFKIDPSGWGDMLDQVTYSANKSIIDVEDIIESMKYAGNMASGFDQPLSDILTALAVMGNAGLKGSQAGTGIQAIFTRGMSTSGISTAGKPPTENVEELYTGFKSKIVGEDGTFLGLGNFTEELATIMNSLTDEELAWFNKKLFGMFQQKAALALGRTDEDGNTVFDEMSDMIVNNSSGTNDVIYQLALAATSGDIERVKNAYTGFKMDIGDKLSPVTKAVAEQMFKALTTGDFKFDFDAVRKALEEAGDSIDEKYGEKIGQATEDVGNFILDLLQIGEANIPLATGTGDGVLKLLNGDFTGAWDSFVQGIEDVNDNIDDLPPELQDSATGFRNLIVLLEGLFALNIVTRVGEGITSITRLLTGNRILSAKATVNSASTSVASASSVVNATSVIVNGGAITSATFGAVGNATVATMMANTTTMTVYASVVNVIGGGGFGTGGGSGLSPVVAGGGGALLGTGAGAAAGALASGSATAALGAGAATAALPGAIGAAGAAGATGSVVATLFKNPLTGTYMTKAAIAKSLGATALKGAGIIGTAVLLSTTPSSQDQTVEAYKSGLGDFRGSIKDADKVTSFKELMYEMFRPSGGTTYKENQKINEIKDATPDSYREQLNTLLDAFGTYSTGKSYVEGMMDKWMYDNPDASDDDYMIVASRIVAAMADYITANNITDLSVYADQVPGADTNIYSDILNGSLEQVNAASISLSEAVNTLTQSPSFNLGLGQGPLSQQGAYDYIMDRLNSGGGITANQLLIDSINQGIMALDPTLTVDITNQAPIVNVGVDVKVDKSGNYATNIIKDFSGVDNWLYQQTQRFGTTAKIER